jgi:hypothetical protein
MDPKMITKNRFKNDHEKWSQKMTTKNDHKKSSQKIITKNHHKKSSQKKRKKNPPLCLNLHFLSIAVNPPQTNYKPQFAPF